MPLPLRSEQKGKTLAFIHISDLLLEIVRLILRSAFFEVVDNEKNDSTFKLFSTRNLFMRDIAIILIRFHTTIV
ncbi:hypothetical protein SAMN04490178_12253 [Propionispora vibrioides]|uniref:Uncharacterized protein n=1 Tax=Propionispora vibrioides TaxID=112903 RepID=A0A1H8XCQ6_9FIRM|nr:hypothetical protein SAMN04490178_12253 [Propionispora vibrioides]